MTYAKQLFTAPMAMLAQAAGAASMPFFASLWTKQRHYEFATGVADSVSRVAALGAAGGIGHGGSGCAAGGLLFMGDVSPSATRESVPSTSPSSPSACFCGRRRQFYSRAFYAAGNTFIPMAAGTVVTLVSLPIYYWLYHLLGAMGLAVASDVGIALQTVSLAVLLHQRRMSRWPAWTMRSWAGACWPAWEAALGSGRSSELWAVCCTEFLRARFTGPT